MESMNYYYDEEECAESRKYSSSSSSEEVDLGVGRSYECVFCKRGFNTAQALGGHMNIHRKKKDRTRNKPSSTKPTTTYYIPPAPNSTLYESNPAPAHTPPGRRDHWRIHNKAIIHPEKDELDLELRLGYHS